MFFLPGHLLQHSKIVKPCLPVWSLENMGFKWLKSREKGCLSPTASRVGPTRPLSQPLLHALACPSCCSSRLPCRPIQRPLHTALLSTLRSQPKQLQLMGRRRWLCPGWALFPEPASHSSLRQEGLLSPPFPRWGTKAGAVRNHLGVT